MLQVAPESQPGRLLLGILLGQRDFPNVQAKSSFCGRFGAEPLTAGVLSHSSQTECVCLPKQSVDPTCPENKECLEGSLQGTSSHLSAVMG